ncbi:MAG: hypothetical protein KatS3mg110_4480 [Pirellulaceae bacterium]|nr:MAG: hypothetical protein KatS3mg110_0006 [Pirellulaceae bacterium]GIW96439.1 MAG: hypothetical protein KatS3mg110_4480 [Pirellulaceae bacterium]
MNARFNTGILFVWLVFMAVSGRVLGQTPPGQTRDDSQEAPTVAPAWIPLSPEHEAYLDQILKYWEYTTSKIERYQCEFTRWVYDLPPDAAGRLPVDPRGNEAARHISQGIIKYMAPDKAMYQSRRIWKFDQNKRDYVEAAVEQEADHWICDGRWIYEFDYRQKVLRKIELPPQMRGQAISKGPLPFLFRAKADQIKARFWIRVDTPADARGEYHLEIVPRTQEDASQFRACRLIIDEKDFLPKALVIIPPANDGRGANREVFVFDKRQVNWTFQDLLNEFKLWSRDFYEPAVPNGWKLIEEPYQAPASVAERPQAGSGRQ